MMKRTVFFLMCLAFLNAHGPATAQPASGDSDPGAVFRVLDISERTYENGPAIAVLLSKPLSPEVRHDDHLRITDTEALLKSAWVLSEDGRTLYFPHVAPEREHAVTVLESLTSADGESVGQRTTQTIKTRPIVPVVSFASEGFLLPAETSSGLPVVSVNVPSVYVEFFKISEKGLAEFVNWRGTTGKKDYYTLSQAGNYGTMAFSGRFDLLAERNRRMVSHLPVDKIDALKSPGVYLAVMRAPGEYDYNYHSAYFLVTDIGLFTRVYAEESLIFVSSLADGSPIAGAALNFHDPKGRVVSTGVTDERGAFRYAGKLPGKIRIITARETTAGREGQVGILPLDIPALDMSAFDLGERPYRPREIFIYSPRDLYRPGETVVVSALLRDDDGGTLKPRPLTARLFRPDGKEVRRMTLTAGDLGEAGLGYYHAEISLPAMAGTGGWQLKIWNNPAAKAPAGTFAFHVEEFLPERMKLSLDAGPKFPGTDTTLSVSVSGEYLYGAPAAGNHLAARVRVTAKREFPGENLKGFAVGDIEDTAYRETWEIGDLKLDSAGITTIEIPSRWENLKSPLSVVTAVDLFETGGRPVTRAVEQAIWPAEALVGIRPLFGSDIPEAGPVKFELIRADREGRLLAATGLAVEVIREDRDHYWEYSESTGWRYEHTQKNYRFLAKTLDLAPDRPTPLTLDLESGRYVLSAKDTATGLATSVRFDVGYGWYGEEAAQTARPDKVVMALDRPAYQPGDIIRLSVTPPHSGEGIIMVEGERPLWVRRMPLSSDGTVVEIPMLAGWNRHNIYISAVVFRPADAKEKITPNRAAGLIFLPLDRSRRKLAISIDAAEKVVPQGPVEVSLTLQDAKTPPDSRVFVTLSAVDAGILSITDFKTPDPFEYFFGQRRYGVEAYDVYGRVIEAMDGGMAALRFGAGADLAGGKRPENRVELLSLFQGPVAFDDKGRARVVLDLPNFNGRLRLMAAAFSRDAFGSAEREMTVAAPVVTQLSTPRFLAPKDRSEATLDVHNLSGGPLDLSIVMTAEGPLSLENGARDIHLSDREKTTLRFPVAAGADVDAGTLRMRLSAGDYHLDQTWTLGIRPGYPGISRKKMKVVNPGKAATLGRGMAADLIPETVEGRLVISPRVPIDFHDAMKGLIAYPYGCLEQTTSRAYPLLHAVPEVIDDFNLPEVSPEKRLAELEKTLDRLAGMQLSSGGFGLWDKNSAEEGWLTVFAADFLETARDMGLGVPAVMRDPALRRLEVYLKRGAPEPLYVSNAMRPDLDFTVRSYAAFVLARLGRAPLGSLRTLYDAAGDTLSSLPLAHMGIALGLMGDAQRSRDALVKAAGARGNASGYRPDYGSPVRDLALTVALLAEYNATDVPGYDTLLSDLENALYGRAWLSTQEKYALFRAGMALFKVSSGRFQGSLTMDGSMISVSEETDFSMALSADEAGAGVTFQSQAARPLYLTLAVDGYTADPPRADASHIAVSREYLDLDGKPAEKRTFNVGELFLVHLRVGAKENIPDALAADLLPAGFEIENPNLKTSAGIEGIIVDGRPIREYRESAGVIYEEFRADRYIAAVRLNDQQLAHLFYLVRVVSPGRFAVPPPFVESMYRPDIRGIGETPPALTVKNMTVPTGKPTPAAVPEKEAAP